MVIEHAPSKKRGAYGSWPQCGIPVALRLSTGLIALTNAVTTPEQFASWGWRILFLLSGVLVAFGNVLRRSVSESPSFKKLQSANPKDRLPIAAVLKTEKLKTVRVIAAQAAENTSFYAIAVHRLSTHSGSACPQAPCIAGVDDRCVPADRHAAVLRG